MAVPNRQLTRVADLVAEGASRATIREVTSGLTRLACGTYADVRGCTPVEVHVLRAQAVLARVTLAVASHMTAAALWDLPLRARHLDVVHISPRQGRPATPKSGRGHRAHTRVVPDREVAHVGTLACTTAARTVADCARWLDPDWGVVVGDAALHSGVVSQADLEHACGTQRGLKGSTRARALPGRCSRLAESPGESLLRLRLQRLGHEFAEQVSLPWIEGRPRVDFLVGGRVVVEFDGECKYTMGGDPARAHWEEKRRQDRIIEAGFEVIRVVWADLWDESQLAIRIMRALERAAVRSA